MKWRRYPSYRNSEVESLGQIPDHWIVTRLKSVATVKARLGWKGLKAEEYVEEGYIFLATPNIKGEAEIDFENVNFITAERYFESPEIMLQKGDVLIAKDGSTLGIVNFIRNLPAPATVNSSIAVIRAKCPTSSGYLFRWLSGEYVQGHIDRMKDGQGVPHLFQADLREFTIILPSSEEQLAIANFLDIKMAEIDTLVRKKEELIEKLQEKRSALISRTVTRGLPPDAAKAAGLNPHPKMKDSGIEWLGEIPEHWECVMLKRVWNSVEYGLSDSLTGIGTVKVLTMTHIQNGRVLIPEEGCWESVDERMTLKKGDLLFNRTNSLDHVGKVGLFAEDPKDIVSFASYLVRIRLDDRFDAGFMNYLLNVPSFLRLIRSQALPSINQANLNPTRYGTNKIPVPGIEEQVQIRSFLDIEVQKLALLECKVRSAVTRLQEYRSALITAVVTGKIDVRNYSGV